MFFIFYYPAYDSTVRFRCEDAIKEHYRFGKDWGKCTINGYIKLDFRQIYQYVLCWELLSYGHKRKVV